MALVSEAVSSDSLGIHNLPLNMSGDSGVYRGAYSFLECASLGVGSTLLDVGEMLSTFVGNDSPG